MKIALIIEYFDASRGGTEQFTVWLAQKLQRGGHEVHVVCHGANGRGGRLHAKPCPTPPAPAESQNTDTEQPTGSLHIHELGGPRLCTGVGFRVFGWRAARWCRRNAMDVVHSMTVAFPGDLYQPHAGVYAEIRKRALAFRLHSGRLALKRLMFRLPGKLGTTLAMEARAVRPQAAGAAGARGPLHILSLCPMVTEQFVRHYGAEVGAGVGGDGRIIELPDPQMEAPPAAGDACMREAREAFRENHGLKAADRVAVFVGHDFRRKGLRYAIEAVARTREWKLIVVGLGKSREYEAQAGALGMGSGRRVIFMGATQGMETIYAATDALLLPTFYDSFGLVAIEALGRGLPVISTEQLGAAYLVTEYRAGTIVASPEETRKMAEALDALPLPGEAAQEALAARAREAGAVMPAEPYLEKLLEIYEQVIHEKKRRSVTASPGPAAGAARRVIVEGGR